MPGKRGSIQSCLNDLVSKPQAISLQVRVEELDLGSRLSGGRWPSTSRQCLLQPLLPAMPSSPHKAAVPHSGPEKPGVGGGCVDLQRAVLFLPWGWGSLCLGCWPQASGTR